MHNKYFIVDYRYLSIWITVETPEPAWNVQTWTFLVDVSVRPIFAIHIASIWTSSTRCADFAIILTSFRSMIIHTDLNDTDETCIYPCPGFHNGFDLVVHIWEAFVRGPATSCNNMIKRYIAHFKPTAWLGGA